MNLGRIGVWRRRHDGLDGVAEIESLGYGTLWVGGSPSLEQVRLYLLRAILGSRSRRRAPWRLVEGDHVQRVA